MLAFETLFGMLFVIWLMAYGFATIMQQQRVFGQWTVRIGRRAINYVWRQFVRLCRWTWRNYRQFVIGFATGILVALYTTGYFR